WNASRPVPVNGWPLLPGAQRTTVPPPWPPYAPSAWKSTTTVTPRSSVHGPAYPAAAAEGVVTNDGATTTRPASSAVASARHTSRGWAVRIAGGSCGLAGDQTGRTPRTAGARTPARSPRRVSWSPTRLRDDRARHPGWAAYRCGSAPDLDRLPLQRRG